MGILNQIYSLEFNYLNRARLEIKEQHLPVSYQDSLGKSISGEELSFSFLEKLHIEEESYLYLKYFSNSTFSLIINDFQYVIPATDQEMYFTVLLSANSSIDSFSLLAANREEKIEQIIDIGIISPEDFHILEKEDYVLDYTDDALNLYPGEFSENDSIQFIFHSESTSPNDNINLSMEPLGSYSIKTRSGFNHYWIYGHGLESPVNRIEIQLKNTSLSRIVFRENLKDSDAIPVDLEEFINWNPLLWRQEAYEVFRWDLFPDMLLIDTESYRTQAAFFKRIAFFTEKKDSAGQILSDEELESLHGWNAHDYKADDLARFFNEADSTKTVLNEYELMLKEILINNTVLKKNGNRVRPLKGGILSISRESTERLRWLFLTHECYHGVFFSSDEFILKVTEIWNNLVEEERQFWKIFLDLYGYNISDEYLLVNEFQAYLMQQDVSLADSYFRSKIKWIIEIRPYLKDSLDKLLLNYGDTFSRSAGEVEKAAYSMTGIKAGDLVLKRKK
jgi:hypothetical protein